MITPQLRSIHRTKLIGMKMQMSLRHNRTGELWQAFMPALKQKITSSNVDRYSLQIYPTNYFLEFDPSREFLKWAAIELNDVNDIPSGFERMTLEEGLYAVFLYKGLSTDTSIFNYIFTQWLPASEYQLDQRPHFEILGDKYRNNDPNSEEEIWIPIKPK